jgi:thioredoxin reductase
LKVAIAGGGPAGISCAVLLKRYGMNVTIYEKDEVGGLIRNAWRVENFPPVGFISGKEFADKLRWYIKEYNIEVVQEEILTIGDFELTGRTGRYQCDVAVVATGTVPKRLVELEGPRTFYEYLHLPQNVQTVGIYGGGDVALDYAIHAKEDGREPTVFVRNNKLKAVSRLVEYAKERGVPIRFGEAIAYVEQNGERVYVYTNNGSYIFDALLIAIGRAPNEPQINASSMKVFKIGDVAHPDFRQSSIAIGDGIKCAMEIVKIAEQLNR